MLTDHLWNFLESIGPFSWISVNESDPYLVLVWKNQALLTVPTSKDYMPSALKNELIKARQPFNKLARIVWRLAS